MAEQASAMARETAEAPDAVARLLDREAATLADAARRIAVLDPPFIATCARGTSDHAATFFKYVLETTTGLPVASIGPSIASVYETPLRLAGGVLLTISQSGRSPDLVALQDAARRSGALTIAILNVADSPIGQAADIVIPLHAGPEISVAATKSFIASLAASAALVAALAPRSALGAAVRVLPETLALAARLDWDTALKPLTPAASLFALGRGPSLPIAQEAALKFKETSGLHAEGFSIAEVMHGPLRLVGPGFPILAFLPDDPAFEAGRDALDRLVGLGATVMTASPRPAPGQPLPAIATGHGATDSIAMTQTFYALAERLSRRRGLDPDRPKNLAKVTETR